MELSELLLSRNLYRDNAQTVETKDSSFVAIDSTEVEPTPIASGGAAQDINTGNVTINGGQITPGSIPASVLDVSNWGWGQTCVFSSTDLDTVSWSAGVFKSADGNSYSISAGNTGNMSAKTYIYLSLLDSTTTYLTTTTPGTSVGIGKVLVAVAQNGAVAATYNLSEATQIVGDNILANTINASKLSVGQLSAITADMGSLTAGNISVVNGGNTIGFTPLGANAIFSGPTGTPTFRVTPAGVLTATGASISGTFEIGGMVKTVDLVADIQPALNTVAAAGGGTVYLKAGTYLLTSDISIPSGVVLEGVSRDSVIIDCNSAYAVKITGTNVYSTGTVTINNGDTSVIGNATVWTSAMVGRYIFLDGLWYEILTRVNDTEITINPYEGTNLAASSYVLSSVNFSGVVIKVTITNATGTGLIVAYSSEAIVNDVVISSCGTGIDSSYSLYPLFRITSNSNGVNVDFNYVYGFTIDFSDLSFSTSGAGLVMTNTHDATIFNSSINSNTTDGVTMTGCTGIVFLSFNTNNNGSQGINFISGCDENYLTDGAIDGNVSDGIMLTATSNNNTMVALSILNNSGYGLNIASPDCNNNQIIAPAFKSNALGNIYDGGTNTYITPTTEIYASDTLRFSDDAAKTTTDGSLIKLKEIAINKNYLQMRVKFTGERQGAANLTQAQIYKNGVAYGILRTLGISAVYSEDLGPFAGGDLLQIYASSAGSIASVSQFRFYFDEKIVPISNFTAQDP